MVVVMGSLVAARLVAALTDLGSEADADRHRAAASERRSAARLLHRQAAVISDAATTTTTPATDQLARRELRHPAPAASRSRRLPWSEIEVVALTGRRERRTPRRESLWSTLKTEFHNRRCWPTKAEASLAVGAWIEGRYNRLRRHSAIGMISPVRFEELHTQTAQAA